MTRLMVMELFSLVPPSSFLQRPRALAYVATDLLCSLFLHEQRNFMTHLFVVLFVNSLLAQVFPPSYDLRSFKRGVKKYFCGPARCEMGGAYSSNVELASFMSVSKGYMGECGLRGGWMELVNVGEGVQAQLYKAISAMLCPTSLGQAAVSCVAAPPMEGDPSYKQWLQEKTAVLRSLKERAHMIAKTFNSMEGFTCNPVQGAMYAFPRFELPPKAIEAAKQAKQPPDVFYAFKLLEETGIYMYK
ncbi:hypothetical protein evm_010141 [Chilo suppressalis]|nr:hypothetical protein evm_010141 [Chilo suppressalis]